MERNKQIQIGLLALLAVLLIANLFGGGFKSWLGQSEGEKIRAAAVGHEAPQGNGNIPGPGTAFTRQTWVRAGQQWSETRDTLSMHEDEIVRGMGHNDDSGWAHRYRPNSPLAADIMKELICMCGGCKRENLHDCKCGYAAQERQKVLEMLGEWGRVEEMRSGLAMRRP